MRQPEAFDIADFAARYPLDRLSYSSLNQYWRCPERWMRRYILNQYEPSSGGLIVGSAADSAATLNFKRKIRTGKDLPVDDVLDAYSDTFDARVESDEDVDWHEERPGKVKDYGADALRAYQLEVAPQIRPLSVQRRFSIRFDGMKWKVVGKLDLEYRPGPRRKKGAPVGDMKMTTKRMSPADANADIQAGLYLAARRAEGNPADRFDFHSCKRIKDKGQNPRSSAEVTLIPTYRTDEQLDQLLARVFYTAGEIAWRLEYDAWGYAPPGSWWCAPRWCGFWDSCPAGGLLQGMAAKAVAV